MAALGIRAADHDIRFVEDNWESPTLGAWEVWLDGMEVTQFTYFQQCGGLDCRSVSIEISHGRERLTRYLQNVGNIWDLVWRWPSHLWPCGKPSARGKCRLAESYGLARQAITSAQASGNPASTCLLAWRCHRVGASCC